MNTVVGSYVTTNISFIPPRSEQLVCSSFRTLSHRPEKTRDCGNAVDTLLSFSSHFRLKELVGEEDPMGSVM